MSRKETLVQLTDELLRALDSEAARQGKSRSAVVREAVTKYLAESSEAEISRQIVDGYTRIPPGTPDEWGDLEAQLDSNRRAMQRRLDEEEKAAGHEPW